MTAYTRRHVSLLRGRLKEGPITVAQRRALADKYGIGDTTVRELITRIKNGKPDPIFEKKAVERLVFECIRKQWDRPWTGCKTNHSKRKRPKRHVKASEVHAAVKKSARFNKAWKLPSIRTITRMMKAYRDKNGIKAFQRVKGGGASRASSLRH